VFLIPYVQLSDYPIIAKYALFDGFPKETVAIRPFGAIVLIAIALGVGLTLHHAKRIRIRYDRIVNFIYYVVLCGFVGGHLFDVALYSPEGAKTDIGGWLSIAEGQSSFGGLLGAVGGVGLYRILRRDRVSYLVEAVATSFPTAWVIGRLGCAVVHDHPGVHSNSWLAVAYPAGGRFDLGLLEALAVLPLAVTFLWLRRRARPLDFYLAAMCTYYATVRFCLDFLRATDLPGSDRRYSGLTPAQWGVMVLFGLGVYFSSRQRFRRPRSLPVG
jgi:phosphatidylglycerol:prolipoprotein diacylglycerol transferase